MVGRGGAEFPERGKWEWHLTVQLNFQTIYDWPRLHWLRRTVAAATGCYYWNDVKEAIARSPLRRVAVWLGGDGIPHQCRGSGILFIHVPRCAGMSISARLYGGIRDHHAASYFRDVDPGFFTSAFTFAVVRDPILRAISAYKFVLNRGAADMELDWGWQRRTAHIRTLDQYLDFLEENRSRLHQLDYVMRPQAAFICDADGRPLVDRLFRLERDMDGLNAMLRRWGLPEVPHINATPRRTIAIDAAQIRRLRWLYAADHRLYESAGPLAAAGPLQGRRPRRSAQADFSFSPPASGGSRRRGR